MNHPQGRQIDILIANTYLNQTISLIFVKKQNIVILFLKKKPFISINSCNSVVKARHYLLPWIRKARLVRAEWGKDDVLIFRWVGDYSSCIEFSSADEAVDGRRRGGADYPCRSAGSSFTLIWIMALLEIPRAGPTQGLALMRIGIIKRSNLNRSTPLRH